MLPNEPRNEALPKPPPPPQWAPPEELARVFNTALVSTRVGAPRDHSQELFALMESPAFKALMDACRAFARNQGISDREAAEELILVFRKADTLWADYVFQQGVERLKIPK
jgi:hypothetical protein